MRAEQVDEFGIGQRLHRSIMTAAEPASARTMTADHHLPLRQVQQDLPLCLGVFATTGRWATKAELEATRQGRAPIGKFRAEGIARCRRWEEDVNSAVVGVHSDLEGRVEEERPNHSDLRGH